MLCGWVADIHVMMWNTCSWGYGPRWTRIFAATNSVLCVCDEQLMMFSSQILDEIWSNRLSAASCEFDTISLCPVFGEAMVSHLQSQRQQSIVSAEYRLHHIPNIAEDRHNIDIPERGRMEYGIDIERSASSYCWYFWRFSRLSDGAESAAASRSGCICLAWRGSSTLHAGEALHEVVERTAGIGSWQFP